MLSKSRIQDECVTFQRTLSKISDQTLKYYFDPVRGHPPTDPYRPTRTFMEEYTFVYDYCTSKPSYEEKMFEIYKDACHKHLGKHLSGINASIKHGKLIQTFNLIWYSYTTFVTLLRKKIFAYLDRYFIPANDHGSLSQVGVNVFIATFFTQNFAKIFLSAYSINLATIRKNRVINNNELFQFTMNISQIDCKRLFPIMCQIYLGEAKKFYESCVTEDEQNEPEKYLTFVNNLWYFQSFLCRKSVCLLEEDLENREILFNEILVKRYTEKLLAAPYGFHYMLRTQKRKQLKLIYEVYCRRQGFDELKKSLYAFILEEGQIKLNCSLQTEDERFINSVSEFYSDYSNLVSECFEKNEEMHLSLNNAIEKLLEKYEKLPKILFKYSRQLLDTGKFMEKSEKILSIFEKLSYKDEFLSSYRTSLEDRILKGLLIYGIEKEFIQTMNKICGSDSTSQLDKLLEDYIESMPTQLAHETQDFINVKILSLYHWQKRFDEQVTLNLSIVGPIAQKWTKFQQCYSEYFPKKKLTLLPYESKVVLNLIFGKRETTFKCNLIQACIIWFTSLNKGIINQEDIIMGLTLEKTFVQRFIEEIPVLKPQQEVGKYLFNWEYLAEESIIDLDFKVKEEKKVTKNVQQDREIIIQAAIMKTMKRSKELPLEELSREVCQKIKLFKPTSGNIKNAIETLVRKDMVKVEDDGQIHYIE